LKQHLSCNEARVAFYFCQSTLLKRLCLLKEKLIEYALKQ